SGNFFFLVAADATGQQSEATELNNVASLPVQISPTPPPDLTVSAFITPQTGEPSGNIQVSWTVRNISPTTATAPWADAVYISTDATLSGDDTLLGTLDHAADLAFGARYNVVNQQLALPALQPGSYRLILKTDNGNGVAEGASGEANNEFVAAMPLVVSVPVLEIGTPLAGSLAATGDARYYQLDTQLGQHILLTLDSASSDSHNELYVKFGQLPTRSSYDLRFGTPLAEDQQLLIPQSREGSYYVMVYGARVADQPAPFDILAQSIEIDVLSTTPNTGGNVGEVTAEITGVGFDAGSIVTLRPDSGTSIPAARTYLVDSSKLYATFDLRGAAVGLYDVVVTDSEGSVGLLEDSFQVSAGGGADFWARVVMPAFVRVRRDFKFWVEYGNNGNVDLPAPLMIVSETGPSDSLIRLIEDSTGGSQSVRVMAVNDTGPAGVLSPGASARLPFWSYMPFDRRGLEITVGSLTGGLEEQVIDWDAMEADLRPSWMDADSWNAMWDVFTQQMGPTWGDFTRTLAQDATEFASTSATPPITEPLEEVSAAILNGVTPAARPSTLVINNEGFREYSAQTLIQYEVAKALGASV
ncbi:MAG: hypothetical protein FJ272_19625, partial [Planctomycetes bacterium]|nr:hypothetical protein [Planctomycetota bacterium]